MVTTRGQQADEAPPPLALLAALLGGNPTRARQLLEHDPSRALEGGPSGFCALHAAALADTAKLVPLLVSAGLCPNAAIHQMDGAAATHLRHFLRENSRGKMPYARASAVFRGVTPLHIAAWLGHASTVRALLEAGADPEVACLEGRTALAITCYFLDCRPKRSLGIINALLEAGADPLCADFHGIGSLVLSPHCPPHIQQMLLNRVLHRYGGDSITSGDSGEADMDVDGCCTSACLSGAGDGAGSSGAAGAPPGAHAGQQQAQHAQHAPPPPPPPQQQGQQVLPPPPPQQQQGQQELPPPPQQQAEQAEQAEQEEAHAGLQDLPPHKHVDVLQAALVAKHRDAFNFFLRATSAEVEYPPHPVNRILSLAILSGDTGLVRRILHSGLRADPSGNNSQGQPHVAVAAATGAEAVLDVLLAHGATVTLKALHHAIDTRSMKGLQLLLARGRPQVLTTDAPVHIGGAHSRSGEQCIMLRLLRDTAFRLRYCYRVEVPRHARDSLEMVEALAAAGYRPTTYPLAVVHNGWIDLHGRLVKDYDPTTDRPTAFDLQGVNRYSWLAAKHEPWSWELHSRWPPAFQAAVQALLLVHRRGSGQGSDTNGSDSGAAASGQGVLPAPVSSGAGHRSRSRGGVGASKAAAAAGPAGSNLPPRGVPAVPDSLPAGGSCPSCGSLGEVQAGAPDAEDGGVLTRAQKRARLAGTVLQAVPASNAAPQVARTAQAQEPAATAAGQPLPQRAQQQQQPQQRLGVGTRAGAKRKAAGAPAAPAVPAVPAGQPGGSRAAGQRRGGASVRPAQATLCSLPSELVMHIIGLAAYPVSAWV